MLALLRNRCRITACWPDGSGISSNSFRLASLHRAAMPTLSGRMRNHRNKCSHDMSAVHDGKEAYHYTRTRFVQDETYEITSRYVSFNVNQLSKIAARAVGAESCIDIERFADGMHNKALLFTMNDGKQVVAKVPNPNAGLPHYTTASEVATMEYMRDVLGVPLPRIYAWSSDANDNLVGAEYIIMEKAVGIPLKSIWPTLDIRHRFSLVKEIAKLQGSWTAASYCGYGSIYFASDLPEHNTLPMQGALNRFAIGPTTGREWLDNRRITVTFDRGPWSSLEQYLEAIGRREIACVKLLPRLPPAALTLCGPGLYMPTRGKKLRALECYLKIFHQLAPDNFGIGKPSAWHGDLHVENIFVDSSDPTKITSIIDWQSTEVAPLFFHVRQPYVLDHEGPEAVGLERPRRPSNFASLTADEKVAANCLLSAQNLCVAYRLLMKKQYPDIWTAFEFQESDSHEFLLLARILLVEGEALFMARLLEQLESSDGLFKTNEQLISENIVPEIRADSQAAILGMGAMTSIRETLGDLFPERGCVKADEYDEAKDALRQCKEQTIDRYATNQSEREAWQKWWPFDE